jgi:hypothetical protein
VATYIIIMNRKEIQMNSGSIYLPIPSTKHIQIQISKDVADCARSISRRLHDPDFGPEQPLSLEQKLTALGIVMMLCTDWGSHSLEDKMFIPAAE